MKEEHIPVLLQEFLSFFAEKKIERFIDATVGMGGHSLALLKAHPEIKQLYGLDQDQAALEIASRTLAPFKERVTLIHGNFREINELVDQSVDGIFFDLGVSSMQLDQESRGFSFMQDGPLDMRKDQSQRLTACEVVNKYSERKLNEIFWEYGEERRSKRAAHAICEARGKKRIETTQELVQVLKPILTWSGRKGRHINPMTLVFQALRIEVNDELNSLKEGVASAFDLLHSGGRLGIISFQSLEDRIVKEAFRQFYIEKRALLLTKKPMMAKSEEIFKNPRSRSGKMRFVEKM